MPGTRAPAEPGPATREPPTANSQPPHFPREVRLVGDVGHGREEHRELQVVTVHDLLFPHARQVLRITRRRRALGGKWTTETVYAITDLAL
jgi:hypothetical protein